MLDEKLCAQLLSVRASVEAQGSEEGAQQAADQGSFACGFGEISDAYELAVSTPTCSPCLSIERETAGERRGAARAREELAAPRGGCPPAPSSHPFELYRGCWSCQVPMAPTAPRNARLSISSDTTVGSQRHHAPLDNGHSGAHTAEHDSQSHPRRTGQYGKLHWEVVLRREELTLALRIGSHLVRPRRRKCSPSPPPRVPLPRPEPLRPQLPQLPRNVLHSFWPPRLVVEIRRPAP